jgi:hypothetical protein
MNTPALAAAVAALFLAACTQTAGGPQPQPQPDAEPPRMCTKIGCEDGLAVTLTRPPSGPFRVEARATGMATQVRDCASAQECGQLFFAGFLPAEVTIVVSAGGATTTHTAALAVESVQPNGEGCPPTCRQARVTVP